ncbi:MAG: DUF2339 domain-containing protein [Bacteroidetes bacterium]|nr:DUF2339 domain-containing protein [Bacteroidota bacterium]
MKNLIVKHWISYLGTAFILMSFLYFLKITFDNNWISPVGRAVLGMFLGVSGLFAGHTLFKKGKEFVSDLTAGIGIGVMYATFGYAGFSEHIAWSTNTLMICLTALTALVTIIGYKYNRRVLALVGFFGGLLTPLVIRATFEQDLMLFLYVLILNCAALFLSAVKDWKELKVVSFVSTVVIYSSYYFLFEPESWGRPFFYASALFVVYMVGLMTASWYDKKNYNGLNLYLGLVNAIIYVFWCIYIFDEFTMPYAIPSLIVGFVFISAGWLIHKFSEDGLIPMISYLSLGIIVVSIAGGDLGTLFSTPGLYHVINLSIWILLGSLVFLVGHRLKIIGAKVVAIIAWILMIAYWYSVAWDVEHVVWFGMKYIPFINPGALVWIVLAWCGFYLARDVMGYKEHLSDRSAKDFSVIIALVSHVVIGGLLTVQIQNLWDIYHLRFIPLSLALSVSWVLYALIIFLWGAYSKIKLFRWFGSAVLILTTLKVFIFDLSGKDTMYKVLVLFIIGALTLIIGYINSKWSDKILDDKTGIS